MPVHIDELTSDVTVVEGELPLTKPQIDKLVNLVMSRIADKSREAARTRAATQLKQRPSARSES